MNNDDVITINISGHEYVVDWKDYSQINNPNYNSIIGSTITLDDTHWADSITWENIEFEDHMPGVAKIEDMCNDYPSLRKAYENFKTIYKMVHQDWQGKQDAGDQFPF